MAHASCAMACVRRSARLMCVSSCTRAACLASIVHVAADGGIMTTDENKPATCGLPSLSDCLTATADFSPMRRPMSRASLFQLSGAGLDPLHTDRLLRTQQNRNHPINPTVPTVPIVPSVPSVWYPIVPAVPCSTVGAAVGTAVTL